MKRLNVLIALLLIPALCFGAENTITLEDFIKTASAKDEGNDTQPEQGELV